MSEKCRFEIWRLRQHHGRQNHFLKRDSGDDGGGQLSPYFNNSVRNDSVIESAVLRREAGMSGLDAVFPNSVR